MSNGVICRLLPLTSAMFTGRPGYAGINTAFPAGNLADRQPKTVCQGLTGTSPIGIAFDVDLGADTSFDTVAIIAANVSAASGSWAVFAYTSAAGLPTFGSEAPGALVFGMTSPTPFGVAPTTRLRTRCGFVRGTSISRRYLRIFLQDLPAANPDGFVNAGVLCIGQSLAPVWNFELGSGRRIEDQSIVRVLDGGETMTERGGKVPVWRGTWSNFSEAEMRAYWSILQEIGTSEPLLIIEDPDVAPGQAEAIHYGQLISLDFHERVQLEKQRVDVTIRELV
jgi:hypothetical protein